MIRFTIDDWKPINSPDFSNSTTLTVDKVKYAILTVLEAWYNLKSYISEENIKKLENRWVCKFFVVVVFLIFLP